MLTPLRNGPELGSSETPDLRRSVTIDGISVPRILYGTAWKEDRSEELTGLALSKGFRGVDTANQRRHYHEAAVGQAVSRAINDGIVKRSDLFLQTKFTYRSAQDDRLPYDAGAPLPMQVQQSFASSLQHFETDVLDALLLHQPAMKIGITTPDFRAWQAMESICDTGQVRLLGIANVTLDQLRALTERARICPRLVQNRCMARLQWDRGVRQFCAANGIGYQGFYLLKGNPEVLASTQVARIAERHNRSVSQILYRFALDAGMIPLTGTSSSDHMQADLEVFEFFLSPDEVHAIEALDLGHQ
jgi:diketogulonate reductase-like aldo/keto reductase